MEETDYGLLPQVSNGYYNPKTGINTSALVSNRFNDGGLGNIYGVSTGTDVANSYNFSGTNALPTSDFMDISKLGGELSTSLSNGLDGVKGWTEGLFKSPTVETYGSMQDVVAAQKAGMDFSSIKATPDGYIGTTTGGMLGNASVMDMAGVGLGVAGFMNDRKKLKMQESALKDQLKNSAMQRDLAVDNLSQQVGVQKSLGGAFGANTSQYDDRLAKISHYGSRSK